MTYNHPISKRLGALLLVRIERPSRECVCPLRCGTERAKRWTMHDTQKITHSNCERNLAPCWFALQTRSRHEKIVRHELMVRKIEQFLPTVTRLSQWKDRKKEIEFPLFPGYCFARFSLDDRLAVLQSPGVVHIVGALRPEPIPDFEIESLRIVMNNSTRYELHPYLKEGCLVEVSKGLLQGVKGIFLRHVKPYRLVLSINLIQQAVSVEVDASSVVPVPMGSSARWNTARDERRPSLSACRSSNDIP
jgi:transcription termination/antitermination protein NusG